MNRFQILPLGHDMVVKEQILPWINLFWCYYLIINELLLKNLCFFIHLNQGIFIPSLERVGGKFGNINVIRA